jgi:hypothetical protein
LIRLKEGSQNPKNNYEEVQQIIINLKVQLEETKVIEETLKNQSDENQCLEAEIV